MFCAVPDDVSTVDELVLEPLDELLDELDELVVGGGGAELPPPPPPPALVAAVGGIVVALFARVFLTGSIVDESAICVLNSV